MSIKREPINSAIEENELPENLMIPKELPGGNGMQLNPDYYSRFTIEPIDYITKNNLNFCQGNVIKYISRYKFKHETKEGRIMDLKKAISNIEKLIKAERISKT